MANDAERILVVRFSERPGRLGFAVLMICQAIWQAARYLRIDASITIDPDRDTLECLRTQPQAMASLTGETYDSLLRLSPAVLGTPKRIVNLLHAGEITTIGSLIELTEAEVLAVQGIGPRSVHQIKQDLHKLGLALAG